MAAHIRTTMHTSPGGPVVGPVLTDQSREDRRKSYQISNDLCLVVVLHPEIVGSGGG